MTWVRVLPEAILSFGGTIILIVCALGDSRAMRDLLRWLSLFIIAGAGVALYATGRSAGIDSDGWTVLSPLNTAFGMILLSMFGWTVLAGRVPDSGAGEWFALLIFAALGALTLARVGNLAALFLGIEVLSLSLYVLVAFVYARKSALRAGAMYLVLAGYASAFLVFGTALVYAVYGTIDVHALQMKVTTAPMRPLAIIGFGLFLVGVAFKLAVVPFHMWAADVYESAPGAVSGVIASASKGATLAAFLPFMFLLHTHWWVLAFLAGASMLVGNLLGLREIRVKRILAYSSVAHVGYILLGFLAGGIGSEAVLGSSAIDGRSAIFFYVAAYGLSVLGAFVTLSAIRPEGVVTLNELRGSSRHHPVLAVCMLVFVVSLAGLPIPITVGFWGKLYLFSAAFQAGYQKLAILGLIGSAIGIFYYMRILVHLFMPLPDGAPGELQKQSPLQTGVLVLSAVAIVALGVFPDVVFGLLRL